jgi:hypothetical protein
MGRWLAEGIAMLAEDANEEGVFGCRNVLHQPKSVN